MANFKILLNGESLCEAEVFEEDQMEISLVKLIGEDQPVLNITLFEPSTKDAKRFNSWKTENLKFGDEITIKLNSSEEHLKSHISGRDTATTLETDSTIFCSFCKKGNFDVKNIIASDDVFICNECIAMCHSMIEVDT